MDPVETLVKKDLAETSQEGGVATLVRPAEEAAPLSAPFPGGLTFDIKPFETIDSTSAHLRRLAVDGASEGTVIFALGQTKGYGRYGREWQSPKGNLYVSLLLRPKNDIRSLSQVSFVAALALGRTVKELFPGQEERVQYKWPNDLLLDGKKVAGILLESSIVGGARQADWLIVGVGVNTVAYPVKDVAFPAYSLVDGGADPTTEKKMLQRFLQHFSELYQQWQVQGFAAIREEWMQSAAFRDESINVVTHNQTYEGIFKDLNRSGELVLQLTDGKLRLISAGEVFFAVDHAR